MGKAQKKPRFENRVYGDETRLRGLKLWMTVFCLLLTPAADAAPQAQFWDSRAGNQVDQRTLLDRLAQADVVFVGEQHDDPATHALELQILQGLSRQVGARLRLAMEMWERDVQPVLDGYMQGKTDEAAFLKTARPWANYKTDYRPLVEYAKVRHIPVVASNAPQAIVSRVGRGGLAAVLSAELPALVQAPHDDYWARFGAMMTGMGAAHGAMDTATVQRFYEAQILRDETMAESTVRALEHGGQPLVLHINGQFHSDFGGGIPRRLLWRRPLTRVLIVSVIPVPSMPTALSPARRALGDFVAFMPSAKSPEKAPK